MRLTCPHCQLVTTARVRNTYRFEWAETNESIVKRRRKCEQCKKTFTTIEVSEASYRDMAFKILEQSLERATKKASSGGIRRQLHEGNPFPD
jgi:transcriptional regulator NrdR family protein